MRRLAKRCPVEVSVDGCAPQNARSGRKALDNDGADSPPKSETRPTQTCAPGESGTFKTGHGAAPPESERQPSRRDELEVDMVPEQLYRVANAAVRRVLGAGTRNREDLVQTVLERAVRSMRTGQFSGACSLTTWVTVIAQHMALDERRAFARDAAPLSSAEAPSGEVVAMASSVDLQSRLEARSTLEQVQRILEKMKPVAAETVVLHDVAGYDLTEIAARTGVSPTAAQSRLVRGRKELLRRLKSKLDR
jgi:RNA polymerase sigma factor (sigma-70 family)